MNNLTILQTNKMTSMQIAEITGKQHYNIMRDIRDEIKKLEKDGINTEYIFELSERKDSTGRTIPYYELTQEGVLQLAARYDAVVRNKLIKLATQVQEQKQLNLPSYQIEDEVERAKKWIEEREERKLIEQQRDEAIRTKAYISDKKTATALGQVGGLTAENNKLKKQLKIIKGYATILAIQQKTGNTYPYGPLKRYCVQNNLTIEKVDDVRWGKESINSYPKEAWKAVYNIDI